MRIAIAPVKAANRATTGSAGKTGFIPTAPGGIFEKTHKAVKHSKLDTHISRGHCKRTDIRCMTFASHIRRHISGLHGYRQDKPLGKVVEFAHKLGRKSRDSPMRKKFD